MTPLEFTIAVLGVYRLAYLIACEDGPFNAAVELRSRVMEWDVSRKNDPMHDPDHWLNTGLNCPLCLSFWMAWLPGILFGETVLGVIFYALGIAGGVLLLHWLVTAVAVFTERE